MLDKLLLHLRREPRAAKHAIRQFSQEIELNCSSSGFKLKGE
jgi:hypothetical protein